jgi:hemolysin III
MDSANWHFHSHRSNDVTSSLLHLVGVALAMAVLIILVVLGARLGTPWHVVGYALYGSGLIFLYLASTLFHFIPHTRPRAKHFFQCIDHAAIYFFIAATYTPITFLGLVGGWRWAMFGTVWGLALLGAVTKLYWIRFPAWVSASLYVVMGWMIVIAFGPLLASIEAPTFWLLFSGGAAYTVGAMFYVLDFILPQRKYFWMHELFHLCVLGGSACHTIVMFFLLGD